MNTAHFRFWPARIPHELVYPCVPLFDLLETSARRYPDKPAVIYYGRRISYRELWDSVLCLAGALHGLGVRRGDRVALYLQNTPHFLIGYFAILRADAVVVPINPMLTEKELKVLLTDSGAVALITTSDLVGRAREAQASTAVREIIVGDYTDYLPLEAELPVPAALLGHHDVGGECRRWMDVISREPTVPLTKVGPNDVAMLPYTSGSTGIPKGCVHTHWTVMSNVVSSAVWNNMTIANTTILASLPLFHVTGLIHSMLAPIYGGCTIVLLTRWDREAAVTAIEQYRINGWTNIATMVVDLLNHPDIARRDLTSLIQVGGGGAPLPSAVGERLRQLTGLTYCEGYGLTETISQTHMNPPDRPKLQCIGIPDFGVDARIIDVETTEELPPGKEGELIVSGPKVMIGYWNRPDDDKEVFLERDGKRFLRTGDIAYVDDEGYFFIVDRTKRMINTAGFKVWPADVEAVLYRHPAVAEACVVGVPDPTRVENVKAFIVLRPEFQGKVREDDIVSWTKERMAAYKYPRLVEFVSQLPKAGTGKILWRDLQEREKQRIAREGYYWLKQ